MKKYNNKSRFFKDWTTQKLKKELIALEFYMDFECISTSDITNAMSITKELNNRGYEIYKRNHLTFRRI